MFPMTSRQAIEALGAFDPNHNNIAWRIPRLTRRFIVEKIGEPSDEKTTASGFYMNFLLEDKSLMIVSSESTSDPIAVFLPLPDRKDPS